jgi:hypothetical protein
VLPSGRRVTELGATPSDHEFPDLRLIEAAIRSMPAEAPPETAMMPDG